MSVTTAKTASPAPRRFRLDSGVGRLTPAERTARGKEARAAVPRSSHAVFDPRPDRPDPITLLDEQAESRVPELVPVRYGRMSSSPFAYFRGAALPMASDLTTTPVSGLAVQACGDAHLSNFGLFGSAERNLVFDLNDFDETLPGPWEWDVKRLAASLEIAGRENGYSRKERRAIVTAGTAKYRTSMREFATMTNLGVWYARADVERIRAEHADEATGKQRKRFDKAVAKARTSDSIQALNKLARTERGRLKIISDPPLIVPFTELLDDQDLQAFEAQLQGLLAGYRRTLSSDRRFLMEQFEFQDMARKVVGVGSVGTRAWIILFQGHSGSDPLFLQVKEAQESVLSRFCGASPYRNQGQRVVSGQRLMQASSDIFLGWQHVESGTDGQPRDFYVRQLKDWKYSFEASSARPSSMRIYAELCGWTLARAHARSGDRIAIAAYLGGSDTFENAITEFADAYADQNERDYAALADAIDSGRVPAERDV